MRIGHGYDVHKLTENRNLIIGGVDIPYPLGLLGHSDADVLTHAIMDSIIGALGKGDIGKIFPDTDSAYKNANSLHLLQQVCEIMKNEGYKVVNIDATIIAQKPKLRPFIDEMQGNISRILCCEFVNIKATTEEKLGFTGREEGISSHAVCLLEKI